MSKLVKITRVGIIAAPIVFGVWLAWSNIQPRGIFKAEFHFHQTPWISHLTPGYRARELLSDNGVVFRRVTAVPIYVLLRTPRDFRLVKIKVTIRPQTPLDFRIGSRFGPDAAEVAYQAPQEIGRNGEWITYGTMFPMDAFMVEPDGRRRVAFSAISTDAEEVVKDTAPVGWFDIRKVEVEYGD
ncbi:MAG: hypothetical protein HW383_587 [Candidatus Magasanikbacteria bacterium]|nr:hypothetical protein [Candidatus Magasanikbacteria bacterium]